MSVKGFAKQMLIQRKGMVITCALLSLCAVLLMMVSDLVPAASPAMSLTTVLCAALAFIVLCFAGKRFPRSAGEAFLAFKGSAPGMFARLLVLGGSAMALVMLYGLLAFALELTVFPLMGDRAALVFLEVVAALIVLAASPVPFMLIGRRIIVSSDSLHPLRELKDMGGAYVPLLALSAAFALLGLISRSACTLIPWEVPALIAFACLSFMLGALWLALSMRACEETVRAGGSTDWWHERARHIWVRHLKRPVSSTVSCFVALALVIALLGDAPQAWADAAANTSGPAPAAPEVYEPQTNTEDAAASLASEASQNNERDAPGAAEAVTSSSTPAASEPNIPALPPVDYYEQPDLEGTPVALEGEATLLQTSERTFTTVIGGADVAYEDADGNVRKIDNTLEEAGGTPWHEPEVYRNRANAFTAELPTASSEREPGLTVHVQGRTVSLLPTDVDFSRAWSEDEAVRYTEARPNIDWQYTLIGSVIKEDIVLKAPVDEQSFASALVLSGGLSASMEEGICVIVDGAGDEVMRIAAPLATDAAGEVNDNLTLSLQEDDDALSLVLTPDWEWMASPERAYPVRIDPAINIAPSAVRLGCVEQHWRNLVIGENNYSYAGYDDGNKTGTGAYNHGVGHGICRAYAEIDYDFSYIMSEARIDSATFSLYQHRAYSNGQTNFGLYRVMEPWDFDRLTWANQESLSHELLCFRQALAHPGYIDWDVRECVNNWVQGVWTQRGFCVKAEFERGMQCEMFENRYADNPPRLTINWTIPDPVDEGRSLDDITVKLRTLTEHDADNKLQLDGVFADGEATPRSTVAYTLDPKGETGISYASRSYKYPDSTEWQASIPNATRYKDKLSNWQSHVFSDLAFDTLYKVRAVAAKDGITGKEGVSDEFLVYKASSKDTLPYIAGHYGVTLDQLAQDNRVQDCLVVGGNTIFVRNPKTTSAYNLGNLTDEQKRRIDSGLMGRGKHCEYGFEPVNMNTGNFVLEGIDAAVSEIEGNFQILRTYNSKDAGTSSVLGRGWAFSFTDRISAEASGALVYTASDGASYWFDPDGAGGYALDGDAGFELERIPYRPVGTAEDAPDLFRYEVRSQDNTLYSFDCYGMLTSVTSSSGLETAVAYDGAHQMSSVTFPSGRVFRFEHDGKGRISSVLLPSGEKVTYGYDGQGNLVSVKEAGGGTVRYFYDAQGHMLEWHDPTGAPMVRNAYDRQGRVTVQYDAMGNQSLISYGDGATTATDACGNVTVYSYDDLFRTTGITYADGTRITRAYDSAGNVIADEDGTYAYDAQGNRTSVTDTRGCTTTFSYDERGRVTQEVRPDGEAITYARDERGCAVSEISSVHGTTLRTFDELGRMTSETDADGVRTSYSWSGADLITETDGCGNVTTHAYDAMGRCIATTDGCGNTSRTTYDGQGRITSETDGAGGATTYTLDARGLLLALTDPNGDVTSFSYDAAANMTAMTDARGNTWTYAYDGCGNQLSETDPLGNTTWRTYDACGRLASETDAAGVCEEWTYDGRGRVVSHTLPTGATETFVYEGSVEEPVRETDALGNVTTRTFDALGQVTSITYPDGGTETFSYAGEDVVSHVSQTGLATTYARTSVGRIASVDRSGRTWAFTYDEAGRMTALQDPLGQVTTVSLDGVGNMISATDPAGSTTAFIYDGAGRTLSETDALGHTMTYAYDGTGNLTAQTDALGNTTSYAYAADGLLASVTDALGATTTYDYDRCGNVISEADGRGAVTTYSYDGAGRMASMIDPIGRKTEYGYDAAGNHVLTTRPDGSQISLVYDAAGHVVGVTDAAGVAVTLELDWRGNVLTAEGEGLGRETYAYDAEGRQVSSTDAAGRTASTLYDLWGEIACETQVTGTSIIYSYDALGRMLSETDGTGATTRYAYDDAGNLTQVTDAAGSSTHYAYDAARRMTGSVNALGKAVAYQLDAMGNVVAQTDEDGYVTTYTFDALSRPLTQSDALGNTTALGYDAAGNVISVTDPSGAEDAYVYDLAGQMTSHTDAMGHEETFSYDASGNMVRHISVTGAEMSFEYDAHGNVIRSTDEVGATTAYEVSAADLVTKVTVSNGAEYAYSYDGAGRMVRASSPKGYVRTFEYGAADAPISEADNVGFAATYELDALGRVVGADVQGAEEGFAYDALGNLVSHTDRTGTTETFSYDALSRLSGYVDGAGVHETYAYDGRGNLTLAAKGSLQESYAYDGASQLLSVTQGAQTQARYTYDAAGRVESITDGTGAKTTYTYDVLGNVTTETDATGNAWRYERNAAGSIVEETDPTGAVSTWSYDAAERMSTATDADGATTTYERDVSGNITKITDALGRARTFSYDAEGNPDTIASADGAKETQAFDMAGRVSALTQPSGATARYDYDALGNLLSKAYSGHDEDGVSYTYDTEGRVATRTDKTGTAKFSYDGAGHLTQETNGAGEALSYSYDDAGRLAKIVYPEGDEVAYSYDGDGNLSSVTAPEGVYAYVYDDAGKPIQLTRPDGTTTTYERDAAGRVLAVEHASADGSSLSRFTYTYDERGNIASEDARLIGEDGADHVAHREFSYTPAGKLSSVEAQEDGAAYAERYSYDAVGNRTSLVREGDKSDTVTYAYDAADRLIREESESDGVTEYAYDADGQLISRSGAQGDRTYSYGVEGRLEAVHAGDVLLMSAVYDGDGNKAAETTLYHETYMLDGAGDGAVSGAADVLVSLIGGDRQDAVRIGDALSSSVIAMAAMTGATSAFVNPAIISETIPCAVRMAHELFGRGAVVVPESVPKLLLSGLDGADADAVARTLGDGPAGLSMTDERYDVRTFVTSSVFDVAQVAEETSTRSGNTRFAYGLERLSEATDAATSFFLTDGRGSVAQTAHSGGSVASWMRYTAFGEVSAGTDMREQTFFGYDAEEQSPLTGLIYLRARHYDPTTGRFGVADTYLGQASDPITQNRYLYCASDPINHIDPTGHYSESDLINWAFAKGGKARSAAQDYQMRIQGIYQWLSKIGQQVSSVIPGTKVPTISPGVATALSHGNRGRSNFGIASSSSQSAKALAQRAVDLYFKIYCGNDSGKMKDSWSQMGANMHAFANDYWLLPFIPTIVDFNAYVSEGNVGMTVLYFVLTIADLATAGVVGSIGKVGVKVVKGFGRGGKAIDAVRAAEAVGTKVSSSAVANDKIQDTTKKIVEWVGEDARFIRNEYNDVVIVSADNTRKVRFDLNHPNPHLNSHMHTEEYVNGEWIKTRVYPSEVTPE